MKGIVHSLVPGKGAVINPAHASEECYLSPTLVTIMITRMTSYRLEVTSSVMAYGVIGQEGLLCTVVSGVKVSGVYLAVYVALMTLCE